MSEESGRQGRAATVSQERRRRGDENLGRAKRLPIPDEVQAWADAEGMALRWGNDEGNRMHQLTKLDDYDPVPFEVKPVPVGTAQDGTPIKAHLLAKRKDFIEEDRAKRERARSAQEDALFTSPDAVQAAGRTPNPNPSNGATYVARGTRKDRGNQILE